MILFSLHAMPSLVAVGFSLLLVLSLVATEELDMRRHGKTSGR